MKTANHISETVASALPVPRSVPASAVPSVEPAEAMQKQIDLVVKITDMAWRRVAGYVAQQGLRKFKKPDQATYDASAKLCALMISSPIAVDMPNGNGRAMNPNRSAFVTGSVGTGKTIFTHSLCKVLHRNSPVKPFFIEARGLVTQVEERGLSGLKGGSNGFAAIGQDVVVDDAGVESLARHYGKDYNAVQELILDRYTLFQRAVGKGSRLMKTHFISNINPADMSKYYDSRTVDRLREMCEIIIWPQSNSFR